MAKGEWAAVGGIVLTIIGATWYLGSTMATEADITELRQELRQQRQELQQEIRAVGDRLDAQMEEIRQYIVDHFDGHPADN